MSEPAIAKEDPTPIVSNLVEIGKLDTLYRDLYLQRARELMEPVLSYDSYSYIKDSIASLGLAERQLRSAVQRSDWTKTAELTARINSIKRSTEKGEALDLAESVYDNLADIPIDRFSPGFFAFFDLSADGLEQFRKKTIDILTSLEAKDPSQKEFYARRRADFQALKIDVPTGKQADDKDEKEDVSLLNLRQQALNAVDAGDLAQLDEVLKLLAEAEKKESTTESSSAAVELGEAADLGEDLLYNFSEGTMAAAERLGLSLVRTRSRRQFSYLIPYSWHPSFLKSESKRWAKDQLSRVAHPVETNDKLMEAVELYLFNPLINSGGTRYNVCFVVEDLLMEDFAEPEPKAELPHSELLAELKLTTRWGLTRTQIENALIKHGPRILKERLMLDPEEFRLVTIPADIFTMLGPDRGWGHQEMWTHFDGYWLRDGGKQALAGGDVRFGGTHDIVSFSPSYENDKLLARFAVMQRKRMKTWHQK